MRIVTFDIETSNWFGETGTNDPKDLKLALVGIHDSATDSYSSYLESELPKLWKILEETDLLVGYNSDHFDIPLLNKYYPGDLTRIRSVDLLKEIYVSLGRRLKLDSVSQATLGVGKSGDGLKSLQWWRAGEIDKVREYCIKDVEITKRLFDFALSHNSLMYSDLGSKKEITLDTSTWLQSGNATLTRTLGF